MKSNLGFTEQIVLILLLDIYNSQVIIFQHVPSSLTLTEPLYMTIKVQ